MTSGVRRVQGPMALAAFHEAVAEQVPPDITAVNMAIAAHQTAHGVRALNPKPYPTGCAPRAAAASACLMALCVKLLRLSVLRPGGQSQRVDGPCRNALLVGADTLKFLTGFPSNSPSSEMHSSRVNGDGGGDQRAGGGGGVAGGAPEGQSGGGPAGVPGSGAGAGLPPQRGHLRLPAVAVRPLRRRRHCCQAAKGT